MRLPYLCLLMMKWKGRIREQRYEKMGSSYKDAGKDNMTFSEFPSMRSCRFSIATVTLLSSPEQTKGKRWLSKTQWMCSLHHLLPGAVMVVMAAVMIQPEQRVVYFKSLSVFLQLQALL